MTLIIGGTAQGKREYLLNSLQMETEEVADCAGCELEQLAEFAGWYKLNDLVRRLLKEYPAQELPALVVSLASQGDVLKRVIVCDEVGCGVVPLERSEREYRETVGRCCCALVECCDRVVRLFCGIPTRLK